MPLRATVVLSTFGSVERSTLESIDRQSLHVSEFEVLIVDDGLDPAVDARVAQLVANRPNVRRCPADPGAQAGARRNTGLSAAGGDYLLFLEGDMVLGDRALERLCAHADETDADICLGKTSIRGGRPERAGLFSENRSRATGDDVLEALEAGRLYRRSFLEKSGLEFPKDHDGPLDVRFDLEAISKTEAISVLATYPTFTRMDRTQLSSAGDQLRSVASSALPDKEREQALLATHRRNLSRMLLAHHSERDLAPYRDAVNDSVPVGLGERLESTHQALSEALRKSDFATVDQLTGETSSPLKVRDADARWLDGVLELTMSVGSTRTDALVPDPAQPLDVAVAVFRRTDGVVWFVDAKDLEVSQASASKDVRITARLRPGLLAGGAHLPNGIWLAAVLISHGGVDHRLRVPLAKGPAQTSVVDGVPVVCFRDSGRLALDVGAGDRPVVSRLEPGDASVVEDSRGSLLTARLSNLDLPTGSTLRGQLRMGGLPLEAWISVEDGRPTLQAWVGGLAGAYPLSTKFSRAAYAGTGLRLKIDAVGRMTTEQVPPKGGGGKKQPPAPRRGGATRGAAGTRARRAVKRVPGVEKVYRKVRGVVGSRS